MHNLGKYVNGAGVTRTRVRWVLESLDKPEILDRFIHDVDEVPARGDIVSVRLFIGHDRPVTDTSFKPDEFYYVKERRFDVGPANDTGVVVTVILVSTGEEGKKSAERYQK